MTKPQKNLLYIGLSIIFSSCLVLSCQKAEKKEPQTYTVKREYIQQALYFTGTVQPLHETLFVSPFNAIVAQLHYQYGQLVHKDDLVITLNSEDLQKQYNEALTAYLKAKDSYIVAQAKFNGTKALWDAGLLAKNNYINETSSVALAKIALIQATRSLKELLAKVELQNEYGKKISGLNIADFSKVRHELTRKYNLIQLKAPTDGILLVPPKGTEEQQKLNIGAAIKAGQVIALLGDLTGIKIEIEVPEIEINNIRIGMPATISGLAFGKQELQGELVAINSQASNNGNALPSFKAIVAVKQLTKEQQQFIKIGMSANVSLNSDRQEEIVLPLAAIGLENGNAVVLLRTKDGMFKKQKVITAAAQMDQVVIASGLKAGDVVAYPQSLPAHG